MSLDPLLRIMSLFKVGRPSAITRSVWTVIVDAIQRESIRRPHVRVKRGEVVSPFIAYVDSTGSVSIKSLIVRTVASLFRARPCIVFAGVGAAMFVMTTTSVAVATRAIASHQDLRTTDLLSAAIAKTSPCNAFLSSEWLRSVKHDKLAETSAGKIQDTHTTLYAFLGSESHTMTVSVQP